MIYYWHYRLPAGYEVRRFYHGNLEDLSKIYVKHVGPLQLSVHDPILVITDEQWILRCQKCHWFGRLGSLLTEN